MDFQENENNIEELLSIFQVESEEILEKIFADLLSFETNPTDKELCATLYRELHSLKGAVRMVGFNNIQNIVHKIEDILGLGLNEFTKCIVLPQGEFSQFVNATKSERVKIIEKLFDLEKYGDRFTAKLKGKLSLIETELAQKHGELTPYLFVTEEAVNKEKEELSKLQKTISQENEKLLKINDYIEKNKSFYSLSKDLLDDKKSLDKLLEKSERIEGLNQVIYQYENALKVKTSGDKLKIIYKDKSTLEEKIKKAEKNPFKMAFSECGNMTIDCKDNSLIFNK